MALPPRAVVAVVARVVAQVLAGPLVAAVRPVVVVQVPVPQQPELAVVRLVRLPQQPEVAAVVWVQGLVASESLRSR